MPSKYWERTKVGFAPYRPYPFFRRLAPLVLRLRLPDEIAVALDTFQSLAQMWNLDNGTKVLMGPVRLANYAPITLLLAQSRALLPT
jgi:hypothetical protein